MLVIERPSKFTSRFAGGMNNVADKHDMGDTFMRLAQNVDITTAGKLSRRGGFTQLINSAAHSLWGGEGSLFGLVVIAGALCYFYPDDASPVSLAAVDATATMYYLPINGRVYFSNGLQSGVVMPDLTVRDWGVETPHVQPALMATASGALFGGTYQVAVTFATADGEESATNEAAVVIVGSDGSSTGQPSTNGSIQLLTLPSPVSNKVTSLNIYMSMADGDVLYLAKTVPRGTSSYTLTQLPKGRILQTAMLDKMVPSTYIAEYKGRLYGAVVNRLYYTEPLRFGLYDPAGNYAAFGSSIVGIIPVEDGIYVGTTDSAYFVSGASPGDFNLSTCQRTGVVPGSMLSVRGADFDPQGGQGPIAIWLNTDGHYIRGDLTGQARPITSRAMVLPRYASGALLRRDTNGIKQVISSLSKEQDRNGFAAYDSMVATVVRNGLTI